MEANVILDQLKPIVEKIVPSSELIFKEAIYKIYSADIDEENLTLGFAKYVNRILDHDFPEIDQNFPDFFNIEKYERWYFQIQSVVFENILKNITENPSHNNDEKINELKEVINFLKDIEFTLPIMSEYFTRFFDYCERKIASIDLANSKLIPTYLYYWPHGLKKFKELERLLESNKIIDHNPNFADSFHEYTSQTKNRTKWNLKQRDLFALLYLIYNKQATHNREDIWIISLNLFELNRTTKTENTRTNFNKFIKGVYSDSDLIYEKHYQIFEIMQELGLV